MNYALYNILQPRKISFPFDQPTKNGRIERSKPLAAASKTTNFR